MYVALVLPSDTACASVVHCIPLTRDAIILHCPVAKTCKQLGFSYTEQSHSQWFYTGGHKAARVHFFLKKSWWPFLVVALSSKVHIFGIFEAHRTLLVERAVLLYWIKQALRPNKAGFSVKNPLNHSIDDWGPWFPAPWLCPTLSRATAIWTAVLSTEQPPLVGCLLASAAGCMNIELSDRQTDHIITITDILVSCVCQGL